MSGRNLAVSDIHGEAGTYQKLIESLDKDDNLYILGDSIDRGPAGIDILKDIMRRKKDPVNNPNITFFIGNHELMMLESIKEMENLGVSKEDVFKVAHEIRQVAYMTRKYEKEMQENKGWIDRFEDVINKKNQGEDYNERTYRQAMRIVNGKTGLERHREKYEENKKAFEELKNEGEATKKLESLGYSRNIIDYYISRGTDGSELMNWLYNNGGDKTLKNLNETCKTQKEIDELIDFVEENAVLMKKIKANNQDILLVHAAPPPNVERIINLEPNKELKYKNFINGKIKDKNDYLKSIVWDRKDSNESKRIESVVERQKAITDAGIKIVFGHDRQDDVRIDQTDKNGNPMCVCIDTSVAYGDENSLTVFDLNNFKIDHTIEHIDYMTTEKEYDEITNEQIQDNNEESEKQKGNIETKEGERDMDNANENTMTPEEKKIKELEEQLSKKRVLQKRAKDSGLFEQEAQLEIEANEIVREIRALKDKSKIQGNTPDHWKAYYDNNFPDEENPFDEHENSGTDEMARLQEQLRVLREEENEYIGAYYIPQELTDEIRQIEERIAELRDTLTGRDTEISEPEPSEDIASVEPEVVEEEQPQEEEDILIHDNQMEEEIEEGKEKEEDILIHNNPIEEEIDDEKKKGKESLIHDNPAEEENNNDDKDKKKDKKRNLPARDFYTILSDTYTKTSGTIPTILYRWSKLRPFRASLSIVAAPLKLGLKGIGMLGNVVTRAKSKKDELQENINNLPQEEFDILVKNLTQQEIRQSKINEIYLYAVQERYEKENNQKTIEAIHAAEQLEQQSEAQNERYAQLQEEYNNIKTSPERKRELEPQIEAARNSVVAYENLAKQFRAQQDVYQMELYNFQDSIEGKSNRRMNIKGWFTAKFNPDNRGYIREMGETAARAREAEQRGDIYEATMIRKELDEIKKRHTKVYSPLKDIPFLRRFSDRVQWNRGDATYEKNSVRPSQQNQTKGKELIADLALVLSAVNVYDQMRNPKTVEQQTYNELGKVSELQEKAGKAMDAHAEDQISQGLPMGHQASMMRNNGVVSADDAQLHQTVDSINQQSVAQQQIAQQALKAGDTQTAFNTQAANAINVHNMLNPFRNEIMNGQSSQYLSGQGANFDYVATLDSMTKTMDLAPLQNFADCLGKLPPDALIVTQGAVNNVSVASSYLNNILDIANILGPAIAAAGLTYKSDKPGQVDFNDPETVRRVVEELQNQNVQEEQEQEERD